MHTILRRLLPAVMLALAVACTERAPVAEDTSAQTPASQPAVAPAATPAVAGALPNFAALVEAYGPAVVNVSTVVEARAARGGPELDPDDPLYDFFRGFGFGGPGGRVPPARGEGSGFIISADGYILTNRHVVEDASEVTVRMTDRREYSAKVVGMDRSTDVAVLKIAAKDLPVVRVGDANDLKPGEWVVAIGSPFGFDNSATAGIVSATARSLGSDAYTPFIQTDVAVNPGNSGGPLFNMQGEVVGINSQIISRTGGYQGVSFAIPIDVAMDVKNQLVATGRVQRGRVGVLIQEVNQTLADSFGLPRPRGALVSQVEPGGPAAKAGLEPGDVILAVDGKEIERSSELPPLVAAVKPGKEATLTIWRDKKEKRLRIEVGELEDEPRVARGDAPKEADTGKLGLLVRPLGGNERQALRTVGRIVVEDSDGPAAVAGVERGDVILAVNGKKVASVSEFRGAVDAAGATVALLIQREGAQIFVPVRIGS
jgi:serine protease Do